MPFFDHNATTPLHPAAREAWLRAADEAWQNASSPYRAAARVHRLLGEARERVAAHLSGAGPGDIVFTSGATEANNAVVAWAARALPADAPVLVGATEHPCVLEPARAHFGGRLRLVAVDSAGRPDVRQIGDALASARGGLVALMAANNETGVLAPVGEVAELCRARGAWYLCDAAQWVGRLPAKALPGNVFVVGSAHKFGGPKGAGFLRIPRGAEGFRSALGGGQQQGRRAGTEDYPSVAAMVAALEGAEAHDDAACVLRAGWRDAFEAGVCSAVVGAAVHGAGAPRLWNTVSLRLPIHDNTRWVTRLDRLGFEVSTGSACATGSHAPSRVLAAMGLTPADARRTVRVSAGWETTEAEWRSLAAAFVGVWQGLAGEPGLGVTIVA
jgi:cysteine desulfurase